MALIDVDLDTVDDGTVPIPEGNWLYRIVASEKKQNNDGKGFHIEWSVELAESVMASTVDGEGKPMQVDKKGTKRAVRTSLKADALWNLKQFVSQSGGHWGREGFQTEELHDHMVRITTSIQEYNGQPRNNLGPPYTRVA